MVNLNDIKLILHKINKYKLKRQENNLNIYEQKSKYYYKQLGGVIENMKDLTIKEIDELIAFQAEIGGEPTKIKETILLVLHGLKDINEQQNRNEYYIKHIDCINNNFDDKDFKFNEEKYLECEIKLNEDIKEYIKNQQKK